MKQIRIFFEKLGFKFGTDLSVTTSVLISDDTGLSKKLEGNLFFYQSAGQTNTSFYLLTTSLQKTELKTLQNFVWNESRADLLFVPLSDEGDLFDSGKIKIALYYAKANPGKTFTLDTFNLIDKEEDRLDQIKKWRFDSGAFWLNYFDLLKQHKTKSIDKALVEALYNLKKELAQIRVLKGRDDIVQALIDRTLYIKYLEDNHIINSYFYKHYFKNSQLEYKILLKENRFDDINRLFSKINGIFNNDLFERPDIEIDFLTPRICRLLYDSISGNNIKTGQLSLFDFKFNIIPVDLISYIYEVFLTDVQKQNGIYYTPKKLAQLLVDNVIKEGEKGTVLDPACGSGMFLSVALNRLIENTTPRTARSVEREIEHRLKLLRNYIFGIEKLEVARRFTVFSLSLQTFRNLPPESIRDFIAGQLQEFGKVKIFVDNSFHNNIKCKNALTVKNGPFEGETFDYIVGNPPFFEIKPEDEEIAFVREHKVASLTGEQNTAADIVANHQISQCFFIKIRDWATSKTRFGFVSNSSNFYDASDTFQHFFYTQYGIEKVYELSRVKDILFKKAKESVVALVFNNKPENSNSITYYPVNMELFSEAPFELLIVKEDTAIELRQADLQKNCVRLRDYLVGNSYDLNLIKKIYAVAVPIEKFILKRSNGNLFIHTGGQIAGVDKVIEKEKITRAEYKENKERYLSQYTKQFTRSAPTKEFNTPFYSYKNLAPFKITGAKLFVKDNAHFRRKGYRGDIYEGEKILWSRLNNDISAAYNNEKVYFDFDVHVVKLSEPELYPLITALLNSKLINYVVNMSLRKRVFDQHSKIGKKEFCNIPIPAKLDEDLVSEISELTRKLTNDNLDYTEKIATKLNELIYDLYDLSYIERQRIKDFFSTNSDLVKRVPKEYKESLIDTVGIFLKNGLREEDIDFSDRIFNQRVARISFNKSGQKNPTSRHIGYKVLNEIFEQNHSTNYLASQEKIWGKECVYIIRKNDSKEWTQTKAYEDGQEILKRRK